MKLTRKKTVPVLRRGQAAILFTIGAHAFAIAADSVEEIRGVSGMKKLDPPPMPAITHVLRRKQDARYVVSAGLHYGLGTSRASRLMVLRGRPVAVAVDTTERMAEIAGVHPLPAIFTGDERRWYRGLAVVGDRVVPVVDPESFCAGIHAKKVREVCA